jgi:uncharacterized protein (TIGR02453 family)
MMDEISTRRRERFMAFSGFGKQALPFFKGLAFHQTKEWFEVNRATYESDVKAPLGDLVEDLSAAFAKAGLPLRGDRKASLFRLNRDVRFSKDKSLYKTHAGAVLTRSGAKNDKGLMYIHIAADGCFSAAGFHRPEPDDLLHYRRAIARAPKEWSKLLAALAKKRLTLSDDESLQRLPRGFETVEDSEIAAAIKRKSFICIRPIEAERLASVDLVRDLLIFAKDSSPLLDWGWATGLDER